MAQLPRFFLTGEHEVELDAEIAFLSTMLLSFGSGNFLEIEEERVFYAENCIGGLVRVAAKVECPVRRNIRNLNLDRWVKGWSLA
jgi:hypothetical protein